MAPSSILFTDVTIFDGIHSEPWPARCSSAVSGSSRSVDGREP